MKIFLLFICLSISSTAFACGFAEPIACKRPSLVLHKKSFGELKKRLKSYGSLLSQHISKKKKARCSKANEIDYQIKFIEKYAKRNKNYFCLEHVKVMVIQSESLIDLENADHKGIKSRKAKLQLIDSGMDVSEALVYYKSKHPVF